MMTELIISGLWLCRTTTGDNKSHGASISEINISKENAIGENTNGIITGETFPGTSLPNRSVVSGYISQPDAKLQNFFDYAKSSGENISDETMIIPLKDGDNSLFSSSDSEEMFSIADDEQTKTANFKNWFRDWERGLVRRGRGEAVPGSQAADGEGRLVRPWSVPGQE